jgi:hypothetical protein
MCVHTCEPNLYATAREPFVNRSSKSFRQRIFHEQSESWAWLKQTAVQFQALASMSSREGNLAVVVVSCAALIMASLNNEKRKTRRWWRTERYKKRCGSEMMLDMKSSTFVGSTKMLREFRLLISRIHWAEYVHQLQRPLVRPLRHNSQYARKQQYKQDPAMPPSQLELSILLCSSKKSTLGGSVRAVCSALGTPS